jgi:hypothetical protein
MVRNMGLFKKVFGAAQPQSDAGQSPLAPPVALPAEWPTAPNVTFGGLDCVGESHCAEALEQILGESDMWTGVALLHPEPTNPYDRNAVGVYINRQRVGYLPKEIAARLQGVVAATIAQRGSAAVEAWVFAGGHHSVVLEPRMLPSMSRARIAQVLMAAGFRPRRLDFGFSISDEGTRFRVMCTNGGSDEREHFVPLYAEALRNAGYKARVAREMDYPYASVSGMKTDS